MGPQSFVFGYGSLVESSVGQVPCRLEGHRRRWGVAMDNTIDLPGYKYFVDPRTGKRPELFVAFLDIEPAPAGSVNGTAFAVSDATLAQLDARERSYARLDVTAMLREDLGGRVYAFTGRPDARERCAKARREGSVVVSSEYYAGVRDGFARLGDAALEDFTSSTDEPGCPVIALVRVDLP
ncbi:MAG: gamma-glutamylcyclotransferase family protein [Solirubrobacteraceae bacterium]